MDAEWWQRKCDEEDERNGLRKPEPTPAPPEAQETPLVTALQATLDGLEPCSSYVDNQSGRCATCQHSLEHHLLRDALLAITASEHA
jgi:hypothetical protein